MRLQYPKVAGRYSWNHPSIRRQMDSIPGTTRPMSLGKEFSFVSAEASLWQRYHGPILMHI